MSPLGRTLALVLITSLAAAFAPWAGPAAAAEPPVTTLRGTLSTLDGAPLPDSAAVVSLFYYSPDGAIYPTPQDTAFLPAGATDFALDAPLPGYYAIRARPVGGSSSNRYLTSWYGGGGFPPDVSAPGSILIDEATFGTPRSGYDVALRPGVVVSGVVTGADGQPVADATVQPARWVDGAVTRLPDVPGSITRPNGAWRLVVEPGTELSLSIDRTGYAPWVLGGQTDTQDDANTLPADEDTTYDIGLTPDWSDVGSSGAIRPDESCLRRSGTGTATIDGLALDIATDGVITAKDVEVDGDPLAQGSPSPALVPYWNAGPFRLTFGTSADGRSLCAVWRSRTDAVGFQAIVTSTGTADPTLDVTYRYGTIGPNLRNAGTSAGWTEGRGAAPTVFAGAGDPTGYSDDNLKTGLVHTSRDSAVAGVHHFSFSGFGTPAGVATTAPSIAPVAAGQQLRADPGTWTVPDGTQSDLTFDYQWSRWGEPVAAATSATLATTADDGGVPYAVRVTARRAGYLPVVTDVATVVRALPYLVAATRPGVDGRLAAGATLVATPGSWRTSTGGPESSASTYAWSVGGRARPGEPSDPRRLVLRPDDVGQEVVLRVTARQPGFADGTALVRLGRVQAAPPGTGDLTVSVVDASGIEVDDATITACGVQSGRCLTASSGAGLPSGSAVPGETYRVTVTPRAGSGLAGAGATVLSPGGVTLTLRAPRPTPDNVVVPSLFWDEAQPISVTGCAGVVAPSYTMEFTDQTPARTAPLAAIALDGGLARYDAVVPAPVGSRGHVLITTNVPADCAAGTSGTSFGAYVDPYSAVVDQWGRPVTGARVNLQRSESENGTYVVVPAAALYGAANPDRADERGWFGWNPTTPGWYVVEAAAPGCATGATEPAQVEPVGLNVVVQLTCDTPAPTPTTPLTVTGTPTVGSTLTAAGGGFGGLDGSGTVTQWLRDGVVVGTGRSYVVQAAGGGRSLRVRETAGRRDFVPDVGRGAPVSFEPVSTESSGADIAAVVPPPVVVPPLVEPPLVTPPLVRAATSTAITRVPARVREGVRRRITVVVTGASGRPGLLQVTDRGRVIATVVLTASGSGRSRVRLPSLSAGVHRVRATYLGGPTTADSSSSVIRLRVVP